MTNISVVINDKKYNFPKNTSLLDISKYFSSYHDTAILSAIVDNELVELDYLVEKDCNIEFLDCLSKIGNKIYQKGLIFLLIYTIKELYGIDSKIKVCHSIDKGISIKTYFPITQDIINQIKLKMSDIVKEKKPIIKCLSKRKEAINYFNKIGNKSKAKNYLYSTDSYVVLYKLGDLYDYFYSIMPQDTGVFTHFDLCFIDENCFILQFPIVSDFIEIPKYVHHEKIIDAYNRNYENSKNLNIFTASDVNDAIANNKIKDIIKIDEAMSNNCLLEVAKSISLRKQNIKIILLAGPSSSGKTTVSKKLSLFLTGFGMNPKTLSIDDYFLDRKDTPKLSNNDYDYESINAIDLKLFNDTIKDLLNYKEVSLPTYNFKMGEKEYNGKKLKLQENDILVIEGLHGLNEKLTINIPRENKYKIYISELTDLNIDDYNVVSTSDVRLLRRIVRDNRKRGYTAFDTIKSWSRVREGEEKYVFPYQDEADYVFNTAFIYEIGVLKVYAQPLLYNIDSNSKYYIEARRLLDFLNIFLSIPTDKIPDESVLKEFIGNSYFE